jgi:hypothetical protein
MVFNQISVSLVGLQEWYLPIQRIKSTRKRRRQRRWSHTPSNRVADASVPTKLNEGRVPLSWNVVWYHSTTTTWSGSGQISFKYLSANVSIMFQKWKSVQDASLRMNPLRFVLKVSNFSCVRWFPYLDDLTGTDMTGFSSTYISRARMCWLPIQWYVPVHR